MNMPEKPTTEETFSTSENSSKDVNKSIEHARELLGKENLFGPDDIKKTFGFSPGATDIPLITFTDEDLERARKNGQQLILRIDKLPDGRPITLENLMTYLEAQGKHIFAGNSEDVQRDLGGNDMEFFTREPLQAKWVLTRVKEIDGTRHLSYEAQKAFIDSDFDGLEETIKTIPQAWNKAGIPKEIRPELPSIDRLKQIRAELPSDASLPSAMEVVYDLLLRQARGEHALSNMAVATRSRVQELPNIGEPERPIDIGLNDKDGIYIHWRRNMQFGRPGQTKSEAIPGIPVGYIQREAPSNEPEENFKNKTPEQTTEQELTLQEKKLLGQVWSRMVLDKSELPDFSTKTNKEIRQMLYQSLMEDVGRLSAEWNLELPDTEQLKLKLKDNGDKKKFAKTELEYIQKVFNLIQNKKEEFTGNGMATDTRWDSWPKTMRERNRFNCVGATLLGIYFLDAAGIDSSYANPHGHVLNIMQLSDGNYYYCDFLNNNGPRQINPEIKKLAGVDVLVLDDEKIDYHLIPLYNKTDAVISILGNLSVLKEEADENIQPQTQEEASDLKVARELTERFSEIYNKVDLRTIKHKLYPHEHALNNTPEMDGEHKRYELIERLDKIKMTFIEKARENNLDNPDLIQILKKNLGYLKAILIDNSREKISETDEILHNLISGILKLTDEVETQTPQLSPYLKEELKKWLEKISKAS